MKKRESNFELLRIIAIFLVIIGHFNLHGNIPNLITNQGTMLFINTLISKLLCLGDVVNHIFMLLTGYFLIKSKLNYKNVIKLYLEMLFYSFIIELIAFLLGLEGVTIISLLKSLLPIFFGQWFVRYYIMFILFTPMLNKYINSIDRNTHKNNIIILLLVFSIIPMLSVNVFAFSNLTFFFLEYFIGSYIRLYNFTLTKTKLLLLLSINFLIIIISIIVFNYIGNIINNSLVIGLSNYFLATNYSIFTISLAISIFLLFKNINIGYNKFINYISSSVLSIYLIHDNHIVGKLIWSNYFPNTMFIDSILFVPMMILKCLSIFIICIIIDKVRILLFDKLFDKLSEKTEKFIRIFYKRIFLRKEQIKK